MIVKPVKKHWYLLSFQVQHPGAWIPSSFVHGFDNMRITIPELRVAKQINHMGDNSVMLAVSYMGYATEREINGMPEVDPPSHTSNGFNEGMVAAMTVSAGDTNQPINPYTRNGLDPNDPHVAHAASEWQAGFLLCRENQKKIPTVQPISVVGDKPTVLEEPRKLSK